MTRRAGKKQAAVATAVSNSETLYCGDPNYAGQRFAARAANDPKGPTFHDSVLAEGQAAQTNSLRWEDYTNIAMDPSDDCTFWFAGNYVKAGAASSTTRIGSFVVPRCK